jgi:ATP-dependent RNA helicase RhlE
LVLPTKDKTYCFQQLFKDIKKLAMGILLNRSCGSNSGKHDRGCYYQKVYPVNREKTELIIKLITEGNWKQILVFTITKQGAKNDGKHD